MKRRTTWIALASLFATFYTVTGARADDDDIVHCGWASTESHSDLKQIPNFKCVQLSNCPAGTLLINASNNLTGCTMIVMSCFGTCVKCSGATTPVTVCQIKPGANCVPNPTPGNLVNCGFEIEGECSISGTWIGPNGCGCKFVGATPTTTVCTFFNCI